MQKEIRTVKYDDELEIEAYQFQGIMQQFPNHFHDYYVIGFIEKGNRYVSCRSKEYTVGTEDLLIFNPGDNHTCQQIDGNTLDYRCINIQPEVMIRAVSEITGGEELPIFTSNVILRSELVVQFKELHKMIMEEEGDFRKEELYFLLLEQLIEEYSIKNGPGTKPDPSHEAKAICDYLEKNYMNNIKLEDLCRLTGFSKYYLIRSFTRERGISPYSYLETIRIDRAKKLLAEGVLPVEVALQTGFSDQSHFTNFFKKYIGLTPRQYMIIFRNK